MRNKKYLDCIFLLISFFSYPLLSLASEPGIEFTYVPPYCSFENLKGRVWNVNPDDYKVCVYIYAGGWWTKPYWDNPDTFINDDGFWECDITTGGIDETATRIAAFLTPKEKKCELMSGQQKLPQTIYNNSVANVEVKRKMLRTITFSGYNWEVKSSCGRKIGPGPNYFSDNEEDVWIDEDGQLHLKISKRAGKWYCTEVINENSLGYGKYIFYIASRIDKLDKNVVLGLFTWDETAPEYNYREIDIEFSRWGIELNENAQYVVRPWEHPGNIHRFNIELNEDYSTHFLNWYPNSIFFQSLYGHYPFPPSEEYIIESWNYTGNDVPPAGQENVRINLWLYEGNPPSDGESVEVVIKKFEFIPWCEGDMDGDGDVDGSDLATFADAYAKEDLKADLNKDGEVNMDDLAVFSADFGRTN